MLSKNSQKRLASNTDGEIKHGVGDGDYDGNHFISNGLFMVETRHSHIHQINLRSHAESQTSNATEYSITSRRSTHCIDLKLLKR